MFNIIWSDLALEDYIQNIFYLEKFWTNNEISNFVKKVNENIELLSYGNIIFKQTEFKNIYQIVIIKQISIYYRIENNNIYLLRFWNNYQDKNNLIL